MTQPGLFDNEYEPDADRPLIDYGVETDRAEYRIHVCYRAQRVYTFPTWAAQVAVRSGAYILKQVRTKGVVTGEGYAVPISHIAEIVETVIPIALYTQYQIRADMSQRARGLRAELIVRSMIADGLISLPAGAELVTDRQDQIAGRDIAVESATYVQVKLDYAGGARAHGGSGNLFLQLRFRPF